MGPRSAGRRWGRCGVDNVVGFDDCQEEVEVSNHIDIGEQHYLQGTGLKGCRGAV